MTVGGVTKRSYWKYEADSDEWVECPNLPVSYEDVYLERGFRKSPPEKKDVTITESSNIGNRRTKEPVKNTR
jgi:hypothetical protein